MTEAEWLACTDPQKMLNFLQGKASDRKLRLFACACCRSIWHLLTDERSRTALEMTERYADGVASVDDLREAHAAAEAVCDRYANEIAEDIAVYYSLTAVSFATAEEADFPSSCCWHAHQALYREAEDRSGVSETEYGRQCGFLRDIFGNPFRPVAVDPAWLTPGVVERARTIYDERTFQRMPELADALEGDGCTNADLLSHLRGPGPHVRGCWALDLILGK
jgi:hypothetical protein